MYFWYNGSINKDNINQWSAVYIFSGRRLSHMVDDERKGRSIPEGLGQMSAECRHVDGIPNEKRTRLNGFISIV